MDLGLIYTQIAQSGILGPFLVLSLLANYRLFNLLIKEKDDRRVDGEKRTGVAISTLKQVKKTLDLVFKTVKDDK